MARKINVLYNYSILIIEQLKNKYYEPKIINIYF